MALNPAILQDAFFRLSTVEKPSNGIVAAERIATAYRAYAAQAVSLGFPLGTPGPAAATIDAQLATVLALQAGSAALVAAAYGQILVSFWAGAVFPALPTPGIAAPPVGLPVLIPTLTALLSVPNTAETHAFAMATALDVCTRTVLVTFPQPSPPTVVGPVV